MSAKQLWFMIVCPSSSKSCFQVEVMDQQAQAIAQVAQATHSNSKALEKLAEASHVQVTLIINSRITLSSICLHASSILFFTLPICMFLILIIPLQIILLVKEFFQLVHLP